VSDDLQRELGRHDAEIVALQKDMTEVKGDVKQILAFVAQAQGSWKTLMAVSGFAAAVGGAVSWTVHTFFGK